MLRKCLLDNNVKMNIIKKLNRNRWNLAFFKEEDLPDVLNGNFHNVHWLVNKDQTRWFADPFILDVNENYVEVLVEELTYSINKGRIAKLTVNRNTWELEDLKIILELDTHLSFPMIFRKDNKIIIIPENSASGKSIAYCYNKSSDSLEKVSIVSEEPLTDATLLLDFETTYMLSTKMPDCNGNVLDVYEFNVDSLEAKKVDSIVFKKPIARNAGCPIRINGVLYRPAQDCDGDYGKGVILQKINYDAYKAKLSFHNEASIYPFTFRYQCGLHTLNSYKGMCVIDVRGYLHPIVGRLIRPLINTVKKILR